MALQSLVVVASGDGTFHLLGCPRANGRRAILFTPVVLGVESQALVVRNNRASAMVRNSGIENNNM